MTRFLPLPLLAAALLAGSAAQAQTTQGTRVLGLSGGNFTFQSNKDVARFSGSIAPSVGVFVADNVALGAAIPIGYSRLKFKGGSDIKGRAFSLGLLPFLRYYVPSESRHRIFGELTAGGVFNSTLNKQPGGRNLSDNDFVFQAGAGLGYSYFITPALGLEGLLSYSQNTASKSSQVSRGTLGLNIGFRFYIPQK